MVARKIGGPHEGQEDLEENQEGSDVSRPEQGDTTKKMAHMLVRMWAVCVMMAAVRRRCTFVRYIRDCSILTLASQSLFPHPNLAHGTHPPLVL